MIETDRLRLHIWDERHRAPFAAMHADAEVMADLGGPIDRVASDEKFERYRAAEREHGTSRFAVESPEGAFLGYCGVMPRMDARHPLGPHFEIGWRFARSAWGHGYATESARAALDHATGIRGLAGIIAYAMPDNRRSQAVIARLGLIRTPERDFTLTHPRHGGPWHFWMWAVPAAATPAR
ncbi:GNAT family N-acetyltransferase [Prosthecomicrobium pneumaticum]|uniref:RimJ/RimL family protein N-acetyltransferase n=1 Tax=Prosthecomicrobium pneumaticum TaxID=81895 RepID=A0A7W9FPS5_9HYPH|nr:GNAT family N-acetyltransferase [Prosthecomicrobium pneumaticum]MBB5754548.1 RimJ/RimL family protein N-acetyltransferase [Prosthecomicrobium pneumaticum]